MYLPHVFVHFDLDEGRVVWKCYVDVYVGKFRAANQTVYFTPLFCPRNDKYVILLNTTRLCAENPVKNPNCFLYQGSICIP